MKNKFIYLKKDLKEIIFYIKEERKRKHLGNNKGSVAKFAEINKKN